MHQTPSPAPAGQARADRLLAQARSTALRYHPEVQADRLAFTVGYLDQSIRNLTAELAAFESDPDGIRVEHGNTVFCVWPGAEVIEHCGIDVAALLAPDVRRQILDDAEELAVERRVDAEARGYEEWRQAA